MMIPLWSLISTVALALLIVGLFKPSAVWLGPPPSRFLVTITYLAITLTAFILAHAFSPSSRPIHWTAWYHGGFLSLRYRVGTPHLAPLSALSGHACGSGTALVVPLNVENPGRSPHMIDSTMVTLAADHRFFRMNECSTMTINQGPGVLIMETVNPGTALSSQLVFTVPPHFSPRHMRLYITNYHAYQNGGQGSLPVPSFAP